MRHRLVKNIFQVYLEKEGIGGIRCHLSRALQFEMFSEITTSEKKGKKKGEKGRQALPSAHSLRDPFSM